MKRVFLIVLDSFGIGAMPDAEGFGDAGSNTLRSCAATGQLQIPNLISLGLGNISGVSCVPKAAAPKAAYGRMAEASRGKDTTTGHWEIAGLITEKPFPTYPEGFPEAVLAPFREKTGRGVLANAPYSGTKVIADFGKAHMETGDFIVYTSADSVFQIAAHEEIVPLEELYSACRIAREILQGDHAVGRVIARPFVGTPGSFQRTANRHDFSLVPPKPTLLRALKEAGKDVISIGKISDIFAGDGITEAIFTHSNAEGMAAATGLLEKDFHGLCFVNLVDFDMHYGHRRDSLGYANALSEFDRWLGDFLLGLEQEDLLIITADHGCDPAFTASTDHTREYVPVLVYGGKPEALGTRDTFADVAATVAALLGVDFTCPGKGFQEKIV